MKRVIRAFLFVLLCSVIICAATRMPSAAPHPVSADAWVLTMTPSPPVGVVR